MDERPSQPPSLAGALIAGVAAGFAAAWWLLNRHRHSSPERRSLAARLAYESVFPLQALFHFGVGRLVLQGAVLSLSSCQRERGQAATSFQAGDLGETSEDRCAPRKDQDATASRAAQPVGDTRFGARPFRDAGARREATFSPNFPEPPATEAEASLELTRGGLGLTGGSSASSHVQQTQRAAASRPAAAGAGAGAAAAGSTALGAKPAFEANASGHAADAERHGGAHVAREGLARAVFCVDCRGVGPGEVVFVAGSHPCLGSWAPNRALRMTMPTENSPNWSAAVVLKLNEFEDNLEYKFIIQREDRSGPVRWEHRARNRIITVAVGNVATVMSVWSGLQSSTVLAPHPLLTQQQHLRRENSNSEGLFFAENPWIMQEKAEDREDTRSGTLSNVESSDRAHSCMRPKVDGANLDSISAMRALGNLPAVDDTSIKGPAGKGVVPSTGAYGRPPSSTAASTCGTIASASVKAGSRLDGARLVNDVLGEAQVFSNAPVPLQKVTFSLTCCMTRIGEAVFVVGNDPALGSWNPSRGLRMCTSSKAFPVWRSECAVSLPRGGGTEFKFVMLRFDRTGEPMWEDCRNRRVPAGDDPELVIDAFWSFTHSTSLVPPVLQGDAGPALKLSSAIQGPLEAEPDQVTSSTPLSRPCAAPDESVASPHLSRPCSAPNESVAAPHLSRPSVVSDKVTQHSLPLSRPRVLPDEALASQPESRTLAVQDEALPSQQQSETCPVLDEAQLQSQTRAVSAEAISSEPPSRPRADPDEVIASPLLPRTRAVLEEAMALPPASRAPAAGAETVDSPTSIASALRRTVPVASVSAEAISSEPPSRPRADPDEVIASPLLPRTRAVLEEAMALPPASRAPAAGAETVDSPTSIASALRRTVPVVPSDAAALEASTSTRALPVLDAKDAAAAASRLTRTSQPSPAGADETVATRALSLSQLPLEEPSPKLSNSQEIASVELDSAGGRVDDALQPHLESALDFERAFTPRMEDVLAFERQFTPRMEDVLLRSTVADGAKPISSHQNVSIVVVSSEVAPWSRTGGLGTVAASYAVEFPRLGYRTMVISPLYRRYDQITFIGETQVVLNKRREVVKYWHRAAEDENGKVCDYIFVEHPSITCTGGLYSDESGRDYPNNLLRFSLLAMAALEAPLVLPVAGRIYGERVCFIANDWHAGLVPLLISRKYRSRGCYLQARTIYVIHNLGHQGRFPGIDTSTFFGLDSKAAADLDLGGLVNLAKGAIICADQVLAVSPTYASEIQTLRGGHGLHEYVKWKEKASRLSGVCNGIDESWSPETDPDITCSYSLENFTSGKRINKVALQQRLGLVEDPVRLQIGAWRSKQHAWVLHRIQFARQTSPPHRAWPPSPQCDP
eukprot:TRINITY_DN23848_c0_g5_i4.p1 TRINITY_DN23848_c0_g5~~TRINITY_DN23848_c0_g5_i4.p1  ORF type:complete len:1369 (+),score=175.37 TRINITY_DN23848_c0_g5_i4:105-4211(+)